MIMQPEFVLLYKKRGETPLEAINRLKGDHLEYQDLKLSYLGRLDPMAEGLLIIAVGEANKKREEYLSLPKEYEFEVLFGFETDTYDLLGLVNQNAGCVYRSERDPSRVGEGWVENERNITSSLVNMIGKHTQTYPPYSSKTVNGKPLWEYSREGKLDEIEMPTRDVEIYSLELLETKMVKKEFLIAEIPSRVAEVRGDFRQAEITSQWQKVLKDSPRSEYQIAKFKISCSSGTYVRTLAHEMGQKLGCGALAFSIKRTKIGNYFI